MNTDEQITLLDLQPEPPVGKGKIRLTVTDEAGKPVAGALVGTFARWSDAAKGASSKQKLTVYRMVKGGRNKTDAKGIIILRNEELFWKGWRDGQLQSLIAIHEQRRIGALAAVAPEARGRSGTLLLQPLCRVYGRLSSKTLAKLGRKLSWTNTYVSAGNLRPISCQSRRQRFDFLVPPGTYGVDFYGTGTYGAARTAIIPPGLKRKTRDIDLPAHRLEYLYGKRAPELRGLKAWKGNDPVTLKGLRGKVVILDFWGSWCGPCVHSMPYLMALHDKYHARGLEIIAVHDNRVKSMRQLGQRCRRAKKEIWGGRPLPFRVAIDGDGQTRIPGFPKRYLASGPMVATYGINAFPTSLLIDKSGILVKTVEVRSPLKEMAKQIEPLLNS